MDEHPRRIDARTGAGAGAWLAGLGFLVVLGWADDAGIFRAAARGDAGYADKLVVIVSGAFVVSLLLRRAGDAGIRPGALAALEGSLLCAAGLAWAVLPARGVQFDVAAGLLALLLTHLVVTALGGRHAGVPATRHEVPSPAGDLPVALQGTVDSPQARV